MNPKKVMLLKTVSLKKWALPTAALGLGVFLLAPLKDAVAYSFINGNLNQGQRDFRVFNNFTDSQANNNTTPDPMFPGYTGAVMAIWKGSIEWGSELHGDGSGDPHQPGGLGSGGANFDPSFQGEAVSVGSTNANIHSEESGSSGGTLAYTETPIADGWRIRYLSGWTWHDGPGTGGVSGGNAYDLQGVACHEYGHALGMGHSSVSGATMWPSASSSGIPGRSLHNDDIAGIQAKYGAASSNKPHISDVIINGNTLTVNGSNFSSSGNQVWFTQAGAGGSGTPIKATNLSSNGSSITVTIPSSAGPGDILVRKNGTGHADLSNAFPTDLQPNGGCAAPVSICGTSPNSVGNGALLFPGGTTSLAANDFSMGCLATPPNQWGIYFYGSAQTVQFFGNGLLCVAGGSSGLVRLPPVQSDGFGDVYMNVDMNSAPFNSGPGQWTAGSVWYMQFWYRDPAAGGANFNLSDAYEITICP